MSQIFKTVAACLTSRKASNKTTENPPAMIYRDSTDGVTEDVARDFLHTIYGAEKLGPNLEAKLQDVVRECGWTESLAAAILNCLEKALRDAAPMGQAMKDAFERVVDSIGEVLGLVKDFKEKHPVLFWSLVAVGILVVLAPWAVEVLGFGELGPLEGSFAAFWQTKYVGYVPKDSWFSFFQRLGMTWRKLRAIRGYLGAGSD